MRGQGERSLRSGVISCFMITPKAKSTPSTAIGSVILIDNVFKVYERTVGELATSITQELTEVSLLKGRNIKIMKPFKEAPFFNNGSI